MHHTNEFSSPHWSTAQTSAQLNLLESNHTDFMAYWRQSLTALIPGAIEVHARALEFKAYGAFVDEVKEALDIHVYEIEALQTLCAWSLDRRIIPMAVDCMFGGGGRLPIRELNRRYTPIELGVRRRCVDSLASTYESIWHKTFPLRLQPLRQEHQLASLRLVDSQEGVLHARFELSINAHVFPVHLCLPRRAIEQLTQSPPADDAPPEETVRRAWGSTLQHNVYAAPVEGVAVLAQTEMTVAQLLSLSIGQVVPIDLSDPVDFRVDGVSVMRGRYGVRSGHYAMKVESILDATLPPQTGAPTGGVRPSDIVEPSSVAADATPQQKDITLSSHVGPPDTAQTLVQAAHAMSDFAQQVQQSEGAA